MAKASAFSLACSTEPSPSMRAASARDSASALAVPVLSTAVLEAVQSQGDPGGSPALLSPPAHPQVRGGTRACAHRLHPTPTRWLLFQDPLPPPSSSSAPTSGPPALRGPCALFRLLPGLRSSAFQAGRGLPVPVSELRAWVGEGTGKLQGCGQSWNGSSRDRDHWPTGGRPHSK